MLTCRVEHHFDMVTPSIFGRSREIADLQFALDRVISGRGLTYLLSGEAGIGKTRLAEELAQRARAKGATVVWGRASERHGALSWWPWMQVARACAQTDEGAAFMVQNPYASALKPLLTCDASAPASQDLERESVRLGLATAALLRQIAQTRPLVLVFDDLHACDIASLTLLEVVARELRDDPVLLVGTYRQPDARRTPKKSALLVKLGRQGTMRALGPLDRDAVGRWLAETLGPVPHTSFVEAVFTASEGNPLFVDTLAHLLMTHGYDTSAAGAPQWPSDLDLPDTIRETVEDLLEQLSPDARAVVDIASVLGRECPITLLERVCEEPAERVRAAVDEGVAAGVLGARARSANPVRFSHILICEVLYRAQPEARRAEIHVRAAHALVRMHGKECGEHLSELAHHFFEGAFAGSWLDAAEFGALAGQAAMNILAFDDAARHFARALMALDRCPPETPSR